MVLISGAVLGVGAVAERQMRKALSGEIETRLMVLARSLATLSSSAMMSDFPELTLHPVVKEIETHHPELAFVVVLDHSNHMQGSSDARSLGQIFESPPNLRRVATAQNLATGEALMANGNLLVAEAPVQHLNGIHIGRAVVGMKKDYVDAAIAQARKETSVVMVGLLAVGLVIAMLLMSALLRPVAILRAGLERIGQGDLETPVRLRDQTEFGLLAESINEMANEMRSVHLRGSLACFPPPILFQMMALGRVDGLLTLSSLDGNCEVYFQHGQLVFVRGPRRMTPMGEVLVNRGVISEKDRDEAVRYWKQHRGKKRIGTILVENGVITGLELEDFIRERIKDSLFQIVEWKEGRFNFEKDVQPESEDILLDISLDSLLLECVARYDNEQMAKEQAKQRQLARASLDPYASPSVLTETAFSDD